MLLIVPMDSSALVLNGLCFGVKYFGCLHLLYVFIYLRLGNLVAAYLEIAARSAYAIFSLYVPRFSVYFHLGILSRNFFRIAVFT